MAPRILCVGNIMMDVIAQLQGEIHYGGDTRAQISVHGGGSAANVATWLAHIGTDVHLCARVGEDSYGKTVLEELDSYGVKHSSLVVPGSTGTVIILVSPDGERTMFPDWACNSTIEVSDLPELQGIDLVLFSAYPLIDPRSREEAKNMLRAIGAARIPIILDPGTVGALKEVPNEEISTWLALVNVLMMNEEEAEFLDPISVMVPLHVVKRGKDGAYVLTNGGVRVDVEAQPSEVVDTTGAGDAFAAGFIASWAGGSPIEAALEAGTKTAAIAVATVGARPPR